METFFEKYKQDVTEHTPTGATAEVVTGLVGDMSLFSKAAVLLRLSAAAGAGITLLEIIASDQSDLSTNVTVISTSTSTPAASVDDKMLVEAHDTEVAHQAGITSIALKYVGVRITADNVGDISQVVLTMGEPLHSYDGLNA